MTSHQDSLKKLEKIEEALTCIICQGIMEDPHALYCGHAFCGVCILQWFETKKICPTCKEPVRRQPIHVNSLQKLSEAMRPEGVIPTTRLTRENWISLFPVEHQAPYIRDEDQDGVILRCSECGWEINEDNYCTGCSAYYGDLRDRLDRLPSDAESQYDDEEEEGELSSGFVVSDNEEMEYSDGHSLPDDHSDGEVTEVSHQCQTIEIDDSSDDDAVQRTRQNRKRRIDLSSDDDESDNNRDYEKNNQMEGYTRDMHSDVEEDDYEEEEDYPEDPFPRSKFIDDYAEEDDDFEEEPVKVKQPEDPMREIISKAKDKMIANLPSSSKSMQAVSDSSSSSDSSDSESDAPDYGGISAPLSQGPNHNVHLVILDEDSSSTPLSKPSTSNMANASSSKSKNTEKSQKRPSKKDKKRQKKHK